MRVIIFVLLALIIAATSVVSIGALVFNDYLLWGFTALSWLAVASVIRSTCIRS